MDPSVRHAGSRGSPLRATSIVDDGDQRKLAIFAPVIKGWSVLYPSFDVTPRLSAYGLLVTIPLAVLPYVAASLLPAWRAAITDPDTVMRS